METKTYRFPLPKGTEYDSDYDENADQFLRDAMATMTMSLMGCMPNTAWGDTEPRNVYSVSIQTPKGTMLLQFWDSLANTENSRMTAEKWLEANRDRMAGRTTMTLAVRAAAKLRKEAAPRAYSVLAALTKYDPGTFPEFCSEFGYSDDSIKALNIWHGCVKEYGDLCAVFTPEQMDRLREIN